MIPYQRAVGRRDSRGADVEESFDETVVTPVPVCRAISLARAAARFRAGSEPARALFEDFVMSFVFMACFPNR
ncbi:MAG: hypothetical protein CVV16_07800 [Gammaproteobacteria bacterium HGW-Gammaproteobacteria-6]|nr:MAG: hypothetical protein CVV16_07800 [Gammaproteobacteria bacterium HGW-Gammaproteobacteria-6]